MREPFNTDRWPPSRAVLTVMIVAVSVTIGATVTGCASWGTRYQDREPTYAVRTAGTTFVLRSPWIPGFEARGTLERGFDTHSLYVESVRLFANWPNGWTEAHYEASGTFRAERDGAGRWAVTLVEPLELWGIQSGEIRFFDSYLRAEVGIMRAKARVDRVLAISGWINEAALSPADRMPWHPRRSGDRGGSSATDRVRARLAAATADSTLPEWIVPLLTSGTLERDLVEAPDLFALFVNLPRMEGRAAALEKDSL